jgi:RHS repeat-associated protein
VDVDRLGGADARVSAATIEPFGSTEPTGTPSTNAIHFTGRENDGTILHYSRAWHYDPVRSRFVSEDPLGYKGGLNVYRYGADNPLRFVDPKGLTKIDVDIRARKMTVDPEVPGRPPYLGRLAGPARAESGNEHVRTRRRYRPRSFMSWREAETNCAASRRSTTIRHPCCRRRSPSEPFSVRSCSSVPSS